MVEQTYADVPFQKRDAFHTGDKPLYSEETANMPVHALIGSAARLVVDEPKEKIRMVPRNSVDITAEKINEKERPESFNIKSSHSLSSKIRGKIGRNR